jgi:hypothetical protein
MDTILIGIAILLIVIIAFVYLKLSRQMNNEISKLNKKIETINSKNTEQTNISHPQTVSLNNITEPQNHIVLSTNTDSKYNDIKEQYDTYVQNNNFDNIYEEDLSENIRNEIDNFTNNELTEEIPTGEEPFNSYETNKPEIDNEDENHGFGVDKETINVSLNNENNIGDNEATNIDSLDLGFGGGVVDVEFHGSEGVGDLDEVEVTSCEEDDEVNSGEEVEEVEEVDSGDESISKINYKDYSLEEIDALTVKELQEIARKNKLKIRGKKDELIERVKTLYNLNKLMN